MHLYIYKKCAMYQYNRKGKYTMSNKMISHVTVGIEHMDKLGQTKNVPSNCGIKACLKAIRQQTGCAELKMEATLDTDMIYRCKNMKDE